MHITNKTTLAAVCFTLLLGSGMARAQHAAGASTVMPATPAASASTAAAPAPAATAKVTHAQFTTAVNNREPADDITRLDNSHDKVLFFTDLKDAAGQTITHRWQYRGKTMAEVKFEPKANRWRVWSSKTLMPNQTGTWTVEVVDGSGNVLASRSFDYAPAQAAATRATHKVQPQATHKVPNTAGMTPAPAASTHGGG